VTLMQQVKTAGSPVRQFFDAQLPDTAGVLARLRRGLLGAPTIAPPVDEIVGRYPYNEMGYASGIRLGLMFAATVPRSALPRQLHPRTASRGTRQRKSRRRRWRASLKRHRTYARSHARKASGYADTAMYSGYSISCFAPARCPICEYFKSTQTRPPTSYSRSRRRHAYAISTSSLRQPGNL
jgi:hypothetical protein